MKGKKIIQSIILIGLLTLHACKSEKKEHFINVKPTDINVTVNDGIYQNIDSILSLDRLVRLDSEPLLTSVKRLEFTDDYIFLTDETARLFCYNKEGQFLYKIDAQGNGPGEYADITFFTVNTPNKEIVIYDNRTANLLFYSMDKGKFVRNESLKTPNPTDMCYHAGNYYYDNRYHFNYPDKKDLHYSLLISPNGKDIKQMYFPHNEAEQNFNFSPSANRLYPSDSLLLYCKDFDNVVYQLHNDGIKARYKFNIPNFLTKEQIEQKIKITELLRSDYAYGINDIYECNGVLSFRFFQKGRVLSALYDLKDNKLIYCGKALMEKPGKKVPLISAIVGMHDAHLISILSPEYIDYHHQKNPEVIDKLLPNYNPESDNPVIALYSVNSY